MINFPPLRLVTPEKELDHERFNSPEPFLFNPPPPEMAPEKMVLLDWVNFNVPLVISNGPEPDKPPDSDALITTSPPVPGSQRIVPPELIETPVLEDRVRLPSKALFSSKRNN